MDSFTSYIFRQAYEKVKGKGDRLAKINKQIDWEAFRPIIKDLYRNDSEQGGRPNVDARASTLILKPSASGSQRRGASMKQPLPSRESTEPSLRCKELYDSEGVSLQKHVQNLAQVDPLIDQLVQGVQVGPGQGDADTRLLHLSDLIIHGGQPP